MAHKFTILKFHEKLLTYCCGNHAGIRNSRFLLFTLFLVTAKGRRQSNKCAFTLKDKFVPLNLIKSNCWYYYYNFYGKPQNQIIIGVDNVEYVRN